MRFTMLRGLGAENHAFYDVLIKMPARIDECIAFFGGGPSKTRVLARFHHGNIERIAFWAGFGEALANARKTTRFTMF